MLRVWQIMSGIFPKLPDYGQDETQSARKHQVASDVGIWGCWTKMEKTLQLEEKLHS